MMGGRCMVLWVSWVLCCWLLLAEWLMFRLVHKKADEI